MPVPVTADQIAKLKSLVETLVADKEAADAATAASNDAHAVLQKAQADTASKDAAEAAADGQVNVDMAQLQAFINGLVSPPA